ncbi:hypothetical protein F442_19119 [Phytophthora nicotianae P10297]|uniref:Non-structural maintenance of chromosome element 4 C-terminal domain-containing protein n=3 Tax=Phytophthora nicotianae TaxID=4792 RepID=W2YAR5_PHYNI|nr:hypothetical protein L917_18494 [Phytophthora nicotianae]ETO62891.1 hypothetical protein F444_19294 [Phytophthora nicotianae P1976]ETP32111.1 hypothetical protein F442_19119 [Phytophthora nicotianae P10297]
MMDTEVLQKGKKARCRVIQDKDAQEAQPGVYTAKKEDVQKAQAQRLASSRLLRTFLVHSGSLSIGVDDTTGLPFLEKREAADEHQPNSEQCILSITPTQWDDLVAIHERNEPLVGHRPYLE